MLVRAANVAPVANAGNDVTTNRNSSVTLDGSSSVDNDGTIIAYEWKEGDTILSTAVSFSYSSDVLGGHTIVLKITDNEGLEDTDSIYITVTD